MQHPGWIKKKPCLLSSLFWIIKTMIVASTSMTSKYTILINDHFTSSNVKVQIYNTKIQNITNIKNSGLVPHASLS